MKRLFSSAGLLGSLLVLSSAIPSLAYAPIQVQPTTSSFKSPVAARPATPSPLWRRAETSRKIQGMRRFASLTPEQEEEKRQLQLEIAGIDKLVEEKLALAQKVQKEVEELRERRTRIQLEVNKRLSTYDLTQETPLRSLVKACSWRFVAALITLSTSLFFSGSAAVAASIVSSDFLSKAGTMYIGERVWNRVSWGKKNKGDTASRSVIKAVAWRLFAMINTLIVSLLFAKNVKTAGQIASADTVIKTTLYILHERVWDRIEWGKQYDVEFNI